MKRIAAALLPLLAPACTEAPPSELPAQGTAYVQTAQGILEVDYVIDGDRAVVDDMTFPVDEFFAAMIDPADLEDAIADGRERAAVRSVGRYRWPGGRVPYRFASDVPAAQQEVVNDAIAHWEEHTRFDFVARTTETDFITFVVGADADSACRSDVGRSTGEQELQVESCSKGTIIHELGHAVGFFHEQARFDRDRYVIINWDNIQTMPTDRRGNFKRYVDQSRDGTDAGEYDYGSIMHYDEFAFSSNTLATITVRQEGVDVGQREGLSRGDIAAADRLVGPGGVYDGGPKIWLYRDTNLTGPYQRFGLGWSRATAGEFVDIADNTASSIGIPDGLVVTALVGGQNEPRTVFTSTQNTLTAPFNDSISAVYVARAATAYRDQGQRGVRQTFPIGEWRASQGQLNGVGDNQITSLFIPPGLVAELCTSETGGTCQTYEGSVFAVSNAMNDQVSLVRVKPAVTLFMDDGYLGTRKSLIAGTYNASAWAPVSDGNVRSMVVGDGLQATLCSDPNGAGSCSVYRGDVVYVGTPGIFGSSIVIGPNTLP